MVSNIYQDLFDSIVELLKLNDKICRNLIHKGIYPDELLGNVGRRLVDSTLNQCKVLAEFMWHLCKQIVDFDKLLSEITGNNVLEIVNLTSTSCDSSPSIVKSNHHLVE